MAIIDKTLWDALENKCRIEMHKIADNTFEVYLHDFNDAIPRRFVNSLGMCNNRVDGWVETKKIAGFTEQPPSCKWL